MTSRAILTSGRPSQSKGSTPTLASLADRPETVRVNFNVSQEDHIRLKVYAARRGLTIKELLTAYVKTLPDD